MPAATVLARETSRSQILHVSTWRSESCWRRLAKLVCVGSSEKAGESLEEPGRSREEPG